MAVSVKKRQIQYILIVYWTHLRRRPVGFFHDEVFPHVCRQTLVFVVCRASRQGKFIVTIRIIGIQ